MKQIILLTLALMGGIAVAQSPEKQPAKGTAAPVENEIYTVVEQDPEFPGGMDALFQWIGSNYQWPAEARDCDAFGTVFVSFIIEADGSVSNARILRGIGCGHDEAVLDMLKRMPKWKAGKQRGKKVRVQYNLPVQIQVR